VPGGLIRLLSEANPRIDRSRGLRERMIDLTDLVSYGTCAGNFLVVGSPAWPCGSWLPARGVPFATPVMRVSLVMSRGLQGRGLCSVRRPVRPLDSHRRSVRERGGR
jgi:hypothetical protein